MPSDAIAAFWEFWGRSEAAIGESIEKRTLGDWVEPISRHVDAIDEHLQWEFGPGRKATHYFCVAAAGDPRLRVLAERWRAAGPADGTLFEFHSARPGSGLEEVDTVLEYEGVRFPLSEFQITVEEDPPRERLDIQVHHPAYVGIGEDVAGNATYVALDTVVGEDDVERWLGAIERSREPLRDPMDLRGLLGRIAALRERATGEHFSLLEGKLPSGRPLIVVVNRAVKRVDHLLMDVHYQVILPIDDPGEAGFPGREEQEELDALEDELMGQLGPDAVYIGRETFEGKRVLHLHAAGTGPVADRLERWRRQLAREVEITAEHDPAWSVLQRW